MNQSSAPFENKPHWTCSSSSADKVTIMATNWEKVYKMLHLFWRRFSTLLASFSRQSAAGAGCEQRTG